ncbi:MAG: hypothetical protein VKM34_07790 [Cyanobacteriota bacterium]|nr:hypothetical protein [Cyanobacteriota bacterium]
MELFSGLSSEQQQEVCGGARDWSAYNYIDQEVPPGLYNHEKVPQGLLGQSTAEYGQKNGFVVGTAGVVPAGWPRSA